MTIINVLNRKTENMLLFKKTSSRIFSMFPEKNYRYTRYTRYTRTILLF